MMKQEKLRIALIAGGDSGEREVSLKGAQGVEENLDPQKYVVIRYDPASDLQRLAAEAPEIDFAFILLHGLRGEDGTVQGFLDLLRIPYQGSGVLGSAVAMDKNLAKEIYQMHGLPVADWLVLGRKQEYDPDALAERFGFPVVVKPVREGSSLGLTLAQRKEQLVQGIDKALQIDDEVMVERYIPGKELTVGVLGNAQLQALPVVEIVPGDDFAFFDYEAKYKPGASEEVCPARIPEEVRLAAQEYAIKAHRALRLRGYSRTDMIVSEDEELFLLETNTIPGMTPTSLMPQAAKAFGLDFPSFLERLIELGRE
ncbi:MAG: D-alanine--D-alanine ligase [Deltaproteobacteria bacterium]|nr:MAG: D-alanine--D-alanine ligase [Deltaproteobacteria bacterium]